MSKVSQVNLSHMLCPALLDPFEGQQYRLWAVGHQFLLIPTLYKLFSIGSDYFLTKLPLTRVKPILEHTLVKDTSIPKITGKIHESSEGCDTNGRRHIE